MKPRREGKQSFLPWAGSGGRLMATGTLLCLFLGCGEEAGPATAPPAPQTGVITVAAILDAPGHFYGREVRLEGRITRAVSQKPEFEFTDDTGAITVEFGILSIPMTNVPFRLTGTAVRGYTQVVISVSDWDYLTPA